MIQDVDPQVFREQVIRPALETIGLWSESAEELLLGTAIQESGLQDIDQIGGPAKGYFQIEPATHDDTWKNYLTYRPVLSAKVLSLLDEGVTDRIEALTACPKYACAIARIKYLRAPVQLPAPGDVAGMAHIWKTVYNAGGRGTESEYVANWGSRSSRGNVTGSPGDGR